MALEGLQTVLTKEAVLATASVRELLDAPQVVEERYKHHVRAYLPLGRAAGSREDQISVQDYEKRLIARVKEGAAPTGYITAEYGYGKTSTAAFLWQRCREANLLAVPPFKIEQLMDLLTAAYAWGKYELGRTRPTAVAALEQLYRSYRERSIADDAKGNEVAAQILAELHQSGRYTAGLDTGDYLAFFESYARLMQEAGYDGVVLLPDELQQYTDPTINSGERDPLSKLFQLVNGLATRPRGMLHSTIIFMMPTKELGQISDQRRDIVDRMQAGGLGFDLNNIYDADFAIRLWERLAREFDFSDVAGSIVEQSALRGLGEIAARTDLGSGPRTVVDGFRVMIERYLIAREKSDTPAVYSPINLTEDFLAGRMNFASPKFKRDVNLVLNNLLVVGNVPRELATKLLAAFPSYGVPDALIKELGLDTAVADLEEQQLTLRPGGRDAAGKLIQGITLRDLAPQRGSGDWLTATISEFIRIHFTYQENSSKVIERAANAFKELLIKRAFKGKWKLQDNASATAMRDAFLQLEGSFPQTQTKYPDRRVYVKVVRDSNRAEVNLPPVDLIIEFDLRRYQDMSEDARRQFRGEIDDRDPHHLKLYLNAAHQSSDEIYPTLQQNLGNIVSPQRLTPLLLLNLYAYLDEQLAANHAPKTERDFIENTFMPDLLDVASRELFNAELTKGQVGDTRIIEDAFAKSMRKQYPDYFTLNLSGKGKSITEYITALQRLPNPFQRSGIEVVVDTKDRIAALLNRVNTSLDTFIRDFPNLIHIDKDWRGKEAGEVRFTLHPWEQATLDELSRSSDRDDISKQPRLPLRELSSRAAAQGYREEEIEALLQIMRGRGVAEVRDGYLVRLENKVISVNDLRQRLDAHRARLTRLLSAYPNDATLRDQHEHISSFLSELDSSKPEERAIASREATLNGYIKALENWRRGKHEEIYKNIRLVRPTEGPSEAERAMLTRPYAGILHEQLEPLRERAAAEVAASVKALAAQTADHRRLQQMVGKLETNTVPLDDESLSEAQQLHEALRREKDKSETDASHARQRINDWRAVAELMGVVAELHRDIVSEGETGQPAMRAYQEWERKVREQLSVRRLDAFTAVHDWRNDLSQMRKRLAEVRETAAAEFNALQGQYRGVLRRAGMSEEHLPRPTEYNPRNPEYSRTTMRSDITDSWVRLVKQFVALNQRLSDDVQRVRGAISDAMERHSREQLQAQCEQLSAQLVANRQPITNLLSAEAAIAAGPAEFANFAEQPAQQIFGTLTRIGNEVKELSAYFSQHAPSQSAHLTYRRFRDHATDDGYVDAASVMPAQDRDQFWRDLAELQDKQLIRVKVQAISND